MKKLLLAGMVLVSGAVLLSGVAQAQTEDYGLSEVHTKFGKTPYEIKMIRSIPKYTVSFDNSYDLTTVYFTLKLSEDFEFERASKSGSSLEIRSKRLNSICTAYFDWFDGQSKMLGGSNIVECFAETDQDLARGCPTDR
jgi:hypothetical protein